MMTDDGDGARLWTSAIDSREPHNIYREYPPPALAESLACVWTRTIAGTDNARGRVLPDGCVDVVWFGGDELVVAGPDTQPVLNHLPAGATLIGARLRPGLTLSMLGVPADELLDQRVLLRDIWGVRARQLEERLTDAPSQAACFATLVTALAERGDRANPVDADVRAIIAGIARQPDQPVAERGLESRLSQRQLRRRFTAAVGYGPKTFARIMRFQALLARADRPSKRLQLADLAAEAGYADQAHMTREVRRLAGTTPSELFGQHA
jgi:AraC-like DNA-binding protein